METRFAVLAHLADGQFRSGEHIAGALGLSRAAVWKSVASLRALGLPVDAVRGRGYRLAQPFRLLAAEAILAGMAPARRARVVRLEILPLLDSTNAHLLRTPALPAEGFAVCLAESQSRGRGRRGRDWVSPFGANLYLSLATLLEAGPAGLDGLSLAVGVGLARALERAGAGGLGLKWPNDVIWRGRKLAGVLIELSTDRDGRARLVVGVGLNVQMPPAAATGIDQPWCDLREVLAQPVADRNALAAQVIDELVATVEAFAVEGLAPFMADWERLDVLRGCVVELQRPGRAVTGTVRGIDAAGALLLEADGGLQRVTSGEVSVRARP